MTPEFTAEQREILDELSVGWLPEDKWYLEQRVLLFRKYRWTPHMVNNPVRVFWYDLLFPFFHWRIMWEHHCRKMGRWAMGVMMPWFEATERMAPRLKEIDNYMRGIDRRIQFDKEGIMR